ncbi:FCD domain-containing protein [Nocardia fusca]|uniref:FCD domain-containing protein n=1 Tax=Nocardia fusca TaxID=941183 RepID=UPI0037C549E3
MVARNPVRRLLRTPEQVPAAVDRLRDALDVQRGYSEAGDIDAFAEADELFYRTLVAAGGNICRSASTPVRPTGSAG